MKKVIAKTILWVLGIIAVLFVGLPYLMSWQLSSSHKETWSFMSQTELTCPEGYEVTNRGWSKAGYMRYCEPLKHGPWEAWSEGYLQIKGEYKHGKKHGTWQWFNRGGSIQKTITYNSGTEVGAQ
ncbi:MAG: hypothetical protein ABW168_07300 [Sedimenticola sp.]